MTTETSSGTGRRKLARAGLIVACVVGCAGAAVYYIHSRGVESTDNAFLEANVVQISARVPGQVLRVYVNDNQHVNKGDLLAEIDPADYDARLAESQARLREDAARAEGAQVSVGLTSTVSHAQLQQANAAVAASREQLEVLRAQLAQQDAAIHAATAMLHQAQARVNAADAEAVRAAADADRYRALFKKDEVSRQSLDRAEAEARATKANCDGAHQAVAAAKAQQAQAQAGRQSTAAQIRQAEKMLDQAEGRRREAQSAPEQVRLRQTDSAGARASVSRSEASLRQAELNRSYTRIYAPESGFITRKSVEPGNFIGAGQALMGLVSDRLWVVANFKETQIARMRPGQNVKVRVDAYPRLHLRGRIDSVQSGSGARFSLMPPENATGNYVKVVQRVPVKIVLTDPLPEGYRFGPGMSVEPEVELQ